MDEDFDFDEFLEQFGNDGCGQTGIDDSGVAFSPDEGGLGAARNYPPYSSTKYYADEHNIEEYSDPAPASLRNTYGGQIDDDIDDFDSSDPFGYGMSSPTPSQSRGFVDPAVLQAPATGTWKSVSRQVHALSNGATERHEYNAGPSLSKNRKECSTRWYSDRPIHQQPAVRSCDSRNAYNLRLRPVSDLPDIYRGIFKFGVFNAVQSKCYQTIMETTENMVVSAPTGGGKTVLFELSLISMLMNNGHQSEFRCVYVAPTKALCSERTRDWTAKFEPLGIKCCEMTGDTGQLGKSAWMAARNSKVIITTSEKWDSLTRGWHDHGDFLSEIRLFLVDEVHVLNEPRGSTLEVVISRMKTRTSNIRFILVSATVPNIRDIANWIGNPTINCDASATVFEFGEEFRPCKITRQVYGFPRKNQNDFQFSRTLDYKLYSVLEEHAYGKPVLVFCSTRKGTLTTAEQLLKEYDEAVTKRRTTAWTPPKRCDRAFHDKRLEKLANAGLGVHHAGLSLDDRRATEDLFLNGTLRVVCATSTLAVGVNLPAHTVVIKGVKLYATNSWQEYSDLDIIQMIGRAGRPQFDKEGVAIILCEQELEHKYRNLVQGTTILESSLHENLLEHINSEIGIGAISDIQSAKDWLRGSFLRQRIQKNPDHYHIGKTAGQSWEEKMDEMVLQAVKKLESNELISSGGEGRTELRVTEYGDIMSKYYIRQSTMGTILKLSERPTVREILEIISCAEEIGDVRLRGGDKQVYNKMKDHPDIRFKIKKVEKASDKAFILIQAVLGGIPLSASEYKTSDSQPVLDALSIFRHTARIARVVVEVAIVKKNGAQLKHGLELTRCLNAKAWEDRSVVLKQIDSIGEKSLKVLAEHGITSLQALRKQEPSRIEMLLNRRPPFGHEVLQSVQDMPQYGVSITVERNGLTSFSGKKPVSIELVVECHLLQAVSNRGKSKQKSRLQGMTNILTTTSDLDFIDFRRISTRALKEPRSFTVSAELTKPSQSICVVVSSESFAGLTVTRTYKPSVPAKEYPTMDTHPKSMNDILVEACEQDPEYWDKMKYDSDEDKVEDQHTVDPEERAGTPLGTKPLPNGNYPCNHNCKDKSVCRHLCCREGTAKPPPTAKKAMAEKSGVRGPTLVSGTAARKGGRAPQKKARNEDKRLGQLEALHKRTGISEAIRLDEGRRLMLDTSVSAAKSKPNLKPNFCVDFTNDDSEDDEESDDYMPDPRELIETSKPLLTRGGSSDNTFCDSELDAIMLTVDTTSSTQSAANIPLTGAGTIPNDPKQSSVATKRKSPDTRMSDTSLSQSPITPAAKRSKSDEHPLTRSDHEPLFLHNSSLSSSGPISAAVAANNDFGDDGHLDEDYFVLDESIFEIVPSASPVNTSDNSTNAPVEASLNRHGEAARDIVPAKSSDIGHFDDGKDGWAEMEDWLLNSGSVQIV